jgi:hypothetical protein
MSDTSGQGRVVSDEERARAVLEQLKSVHAFDLAYEMMVGLVSFGYQKMGLADETRPVRDLSDARVSIELLRALLEVVEREEGDERASGIRDTLAQMQLAFAHAVQLANAEQAAAAAEEAGEAATDAPAEDEPAQKKRPAPKRKPAAKKRPAVKKQPAEKKKPAGES